MQLLKKLKKDNKGFTLVEIIVVLVILAVLAAFTIPTMMGFVNDAKGKANLALAREVYVAAQSAATEKVATQKVTAASPAITGDALGTNLSGTTATLPNASMKTMLGSSDIPSDASWVTVCEGGTGAATGKVSSVALTIAGKVITITPGGAAVVTDAPSS